MLMGSTGQDTAQRAVLPLLPDVWGQTATALKAWRSSGTSVCSLHVTSPALLVQDSQDVCVCVCVHVYRYVHERERRMESMKAYCHLDTASAA